MAVTSSRYFAAKELSDWLQSNSMEFEDEFSVREIYEHLKGREIFREAGQVKDALKILDELGHVRQIPNGIKRGRPSMKFEMHPSLKTKPYDDVRKIRKKPR